MRWLLLLFYLGISSGVSGQNYSPDPPRPQMWGLQFVSHEAIKDARTSLCLTPEHPLKLQEDFTLDFEVRFDSATYTFGYVFRLILGEEENFDMVSDMSTEPKATFICGQKSVAEFRLLEDPLFRFGQWMHVQMRVDRRNDSIVLRVGEAERRIAKHLEPLPARIWFGACDHPSFYTTDVPKMAVRNIRISNKRDKLVRHWYLGRHVEDRVYDQTRRHPALAINPIWLIDNCTWWSQRLSMTVPAGYLHVAADPHSGRVYFASGDYLGIYDNTAPAAGLQTPALRNAMPFTIKPNQLLFDPRRGRLVAYDYDTHSISTLHPDSLRWSAAGPVQPVSRYWHHNALFLPESDRIVTFGGYGEHTYKSLLTTIRLNPAGRVEGWETHDLGEALPPRYLSGMVRQGGDSLLVIGGYGSATGLQYESPRNFYDIRRIDLTTGQIEELGELQRGKNDEHFVLGRDMILSRDGKRVYALVYSDKHFASEITLVGIELATGRMTPYATPIPYEFTDIESFCTLIHDRKNGELLLVETRLTGADQTRINIYSLGYPPRQVADTLQSPRQMSTWWRWLIAGVMVALIGWGWGELSRRRRLRKAIPAPAPAAVQKTDHHQIYRVEKHPSSILLLGGFQVVDKKGRDITGQFTQTVRALFLLILLDTYKNGRGISSQKLNEILWFDKEPEEARNNRNVNIHKLRMLLREVGEANISNENSYWQLDLQEGVFCDYSSLLQVCRDVEKNSAPDPAALETLVELASLGKLLPNTQTDWSDGYKSEFSIRLIELLMQISRYDYVQQHPQLLLRIGDAILVHDSLDEDAIRIKCTALQRMGKRNQAKQVYEAFVAEFRKALDSSPDFQLSEIQK